LWRGHDEEAGRPVDATLIDRVAVPPGFMASLLPLLTPAAANPRGRAWRSGNGRGVSAMSRGTERKTPGLSQSPLY
jgi:hypothetical protein